MTFTRQTYRAWNGLKPAEESGKRIPAERLWVNPDCGLKTRGWPETRAALANMVQAAQNLRRDDEY